MFVVKDTMLQTTGINILETLKQELQLVGIHKFDVIKDNDDNIQFNCPVHKGGQEKKPSCGMLCVDKGSTKAGAVNCFTCGLKTDLPGFISICFGYEDNGKFGEQWLLEHFATIIFENRHLIFSFNKPKMEKPTYVTEEELVKYSHYHPYMYYRKLTNEIIHKFDVGFDAETQSITFPVWDKMGNCVFIARRSIHTHFFNYPKNVDKPVYGLNFITPDIKEVIICESIFNALTSWVYGKPAIALLGLGSSHQMQELKNSHIRKFILCMDGDIEGDTAMKKITKQLNKTQICRRYYMPDGRDLNDLSKEEFDELIQYYITI